MAEAFQIEIRNLHQLADAWAAMAVKAVLEPDDMDVLSDLARMLRRLARPQTRTER